MNTSTDISTIKLWFERAVPNPTDRNRGVQVGAHFEECGEMAEALAQESLAEDLNQSAVFFKEAGMIEIDSPLVDRIELLDSLCDQIVTAIGVAHMFGMDIAGALNEVNKSNWSKFVDGQPQFQANGKIAKGAGYQPPDLTPFV